MSFLDRIKHAGSNAIHNVENFGDKVVDRAKKVGANVVDKAEDIGSDVAKGVQAAEHHAVRSLQAQGNQIRYNLDKAFEGAKRVGSTVVNKAEEIGSNVVDAGKTAGSTVARLAAKGFDQLTHPGNPNPPAAQGLEFAETKGASLLAYDAKKGEVYQFQDGKKWQVADVSEDKKTGFRAIALQPVDQNDKRTIVAFAGTDPTSGKDWLTDAGQALGLQTKQYDQAVNFANKWKASEGDNVTLTGHSLGGGLASFASIKTGLGATAINSAPLALNHLGGNPLSSSVRNNPNITQYYVPGEVLTNIDNNNLLDVRPGNKIAVQGRYSILNPLAPLLNHSSESAAPNISKPDKV